MKHFLKKISLIIGIYALGIIVFIAAVHLIVQKYASFEISNNPKYAIFGHSHPACAFNDNLRGEVKNLSKSGEGYFYNYQKVQEILPKNNLKGIFLEYTNNQISARMDNWIWGGEQMRTFLPWHTPFISNEELKFLYHKNENEFSQAISASTLLNFRRILTFDFKISTRYGGYKLLEETYTKKDNAYEHERIIETHNPLEISPDNIEYLEKIVQYCSNNNVKVYFIRSPQHSDYPRENEELLLKIKQEKFDSIPFLDFDRFPLRDNEFADIGHINQKGAEVFTKWFNKLIQNGLLKSDNAPEFAETELQKMIRKEQDY